MHVRGFKCQQVGGEKKIQSKGGKWSHVSYDLAHRVISLSASSNVKDMSRLTEKQERWCLQSDLHSWTYRRDGCMRGEKGWMNEWRRRNVIQNQWEKYVTINTALAPRFTTIQLKQGVKTFFSLSILQSKCQCKQSNRHLWLTCSQNLLRTSWQCLSAL